MFRGEVPLSYISYLMNMSEHQVHSVVRGNYEDMNQ